MSGAGELLIVGAGWSGAVVARELAEQGLRSRVIDRRPHAGGNCHTARDPETGILLHCYGPHIFNTDLPEVWTYVNRWAPFLPFINRVKATTARGVFSLPINLLTLNQFFGKTFSPREARAFVAGLGEPGQGEPRNFEEAALRGLGRELYETFFYGYTVKQWGVEPREIPAAVFRRLPIRFDYNDNYYDKPFQGIPAAGYTDVILRLLDHPLIRLELNTPFSPDQAKAARHTVYTGSIDHYFGCDEGRLGYRSVEWERSLHAGDYQGVACMNYPDLSVPWTRKVEPKHFAPAETHDRTVVFTETSREWREGDDFFYPMRLTADLALLARYQARAAREPRLSFLGRLGSYRYLDMDATIADALAFSRELRPQLERR